MRLAIGIGLLAAAAAIMIIAKFSLDKKQPPQLHSITIYIGGDTLQSIGVDGYLYVPDFYDVEFLDIDTAYTLDTIQLKGINSVLKKVN